LKKHVFALITIALFVHYFAPAHLFGADDKFGIGVKGGFNKLEGDWKEPRYNPMGSFTFSYHPIPYFGVGAEVNTSTLRTKSYADLISSVNDPAMIDYNLFQVSSLPIELDFRFNFSPFTTVNPFASIGFGGLWWDARYDGKTILDLNAEDQKGMSLFFKTSGGIEFIFDNGLGLMLGADFRYSAFDLVDQIESGDENDGITSVWVGLNYYISRKDPSDLDSDNIPRQLDLDLYRPEDRNGFWDHDGKPDYGKAPKDSKSPTLIHYPIFRTEAGKNLKINAVITSETPIRTAAVLYRTTGTTKWKLAPLKNSVELKYEGTIPGRDITEAGIDYCVVAVDQNLKGIGYSGLPKRPIVVNVDKNGNSWRVVSGIAAFLGWGAAAYIVMRKQNIN